MDRRWYIVQTYSGSENSVKTDLERRIESMGMSEYIFQVMIPEEKTIETKADGSKKEKMKKMFPGYVFVEMIVTDEAWFVVRNTPKVTGFLGSSGGGTKPVPLPAEEINLILKKVGLLEKPSFNINIGDKVIVTKGAMKDTEAEVAMVNEEKATATILVEFFGRMTPTEIDLASIKKKD